MLMLLVYFIKSNICGDEGLAYHYKYNSLSVYCEFYSLKLGYVRPDQETITPRPKSHYDFVGVGTIKCPITTNVISEINRRIVKLPNYTNEIEWYVLKLENIWHIDGEYFQINYATIYFVSTDGNAVYYTTHFPMNEYYSIYSDPFIWKPGQFIESENKYFNMWISHTHSIENNMIYISSNEIYLYATWKYTDDILTRTRYNNEYGDDTMEYSTIYENDSIVYLSVRPTIYESDCESDYISDYENKYENESITYSTTIESDYINDYENKYENESITYSTTIEQDYISDYENKYENES